MDELFKKLAELSPLLITFLVTWLGVITSRQQNSERERKLFMDGIETERKEARETVKRVEELEKANTAIAAKYKQDTDALNQRITSNSDQLAKVEGALSQAEKLIEEISKERDGAKLELDLTNQKLVNTRQQLEAKLNEVQTALENLKGDYDLMTKTYNDLQEERKRVEKAFQDRVSKLETDLAAAETRLSELEIKLAETEKERDGLRQQNTDLTRRVSELESERDDLQRQVNELRTELNTLRDTGPKPDNTDLSTDTELPLGSEEP